MDDSFNVYWLHLEEHTDPYNEGYVGITNNPQRRRFQHRTSANPLTQIVDIMQKYGKDALKMTVLKNNLSKSEALQLEKHYRPKRDIGWNKSIGGHVLYNIENHPVTLFHISDPSKEYHFETITEAANTLGIGRLRINDALKRKNNSYGRDGWHVVHENTDKNTIIDWKEKVRQGQLGLKKVQTKSKIWVAVQLMNINNPDKIYTFPSFAKAIKELKLKKSSLEHKLQRKHKTPNKEGWCIWKLESQDLSNEEIKH